MSNKESITIRVTGKFGKKEHSTEQTKIQKKFDADYLESLIDKATPRWVGIDADEWLRELRGELRGKI